MTAISRSVAGMGVAHGTGAAHPRRASLNSHVKGAGARAMHYLRLAVRINQINRYSATREMRRHRR